MKEEKEIAARLLFAIEYTPKKGSSAIKFRTQHSFLHVVKGKCIYRIGKDTLSVETGETAYLPKGASYSYEFEDECFCRQVEFDIVGSFSALAHPYKLEYSDNPETLIKEIIRLYGRHDRASGFLALSRLYSLCALIPEGEKTAQRESRINPAVDYINEHFAEKLCVKTLANLCFMSEAQLRRHFKTELNTTPIEYKNRLRIEKAKSILLYDIADIGETAQKLGFDNVYAFSAMFKKYVGRSPTDFARINKAFKPESD